METVSTRYVHRNTYQTTDENGKATLTLYNEGYVLINAFRTEDEEGRYIVGPSVLVHVLPTNDLESVKLQLRKELDEVYYDENYPEIVFTPENWLLVKAPAIHGGFRQQQQSQEVPGYSCRASQQRHQAG